MKASKGKGNNFRNPGSIIMDRKTKDTRERETKELRQEEESDRYMCVNKEIMKHQRCEPSTLLNATYYNIISDRKNKQSVSYFNQASI